MDKPKEPHGWRLYDTEGACHTWDVTLEDGQVVLSLDDGLKEGLTFRALPRILQRVLSLLVPCLPLRGETGGVLWDGTPPSGTRQSLCVRDGGPGGVHLVMDDASDQRMRFFLDTDARIELVRLLGASQYGPVRHTCPRCAVRADGSAPL